jgi:nucleoside-diphosphate kinase
MTATQTTPKTRQERISNLGQTLILVKPDAVHRGLIGQILARFEARGLAVVGLKLIHLDTARAGKLYEPHVGRPFYDGLVSYMTSGPIVAIALEGHDVITVARKMMGATKPTEAEPGTIRGDFAQRIDFNIVHGSDSPESAARELPIFFGQGEIVAHDPSFSLWV